MKECKRTEKENEKIKEKKEKNNATVIPEHEQYISLGYKSDKTSAIMFVYHNEMECAKYGKK